MIELPGSGYFVTGTDTGVGKTHASCWLLQQWSQQGRRAVGMKPVAAGDDGDAKALSRAGGVPVPANWLCPYPLHDPVSPHVAAAREGIEIDLRHIQYAYSQLAAMAEVVLVEGAGGWLVPLSPGLDIAGLAHSLRLPVILVVGMRLGCLNHALLTVAAIAGSGCTLAGWIANRIDPQMAAYADNLATLRERINAPLLAELPWLQPAAGQLPLCR